MADTLRAGDEIRCSRCRRWHAVERRPSPSTHAYAQQMLFFQCGGQWFYAGQAGVPSRHEQRSPAKPLHSVVD